MKYLKIIQLRRQGEGADGIYQIAAGNLGLFGVAFFGHKGKAGDAERLEAVWQRILWVFYPWRQLKEAISKLRPVPAGYKFTKIDGGVLVLLAVIGILIAVFGEHGGAVEAVAIGVIVPVKSLADFKRAVKVGAHVCCIWHQASAGRDEKGVIKYRDEDRGVREVSRVQSNSFALKTTKQDGSTADSWCDWPKARTCKIEGDRVTILEPDYRIRNVAESDLPIIPILTYWVEEG